MNEPITDSPQEAEGNRAGVIGLVLSCIGLFICIFALPGLVISIIGSRKQPKTAAVVGIVLGSIGMLQALLIIPLAIGLLLPALSKARMQAREMQESRQINEAHRSLVQYGQSDAYKAAEAEGKPHAEWNSENVKKQLGNDSWGNAYRVEGDGTTVPKISSAGPDGVHDTEDDVTPDSTSTKDGG